METKMQEISKEEFIESYTPAPGMLLLEKDSGTEQVGRIWVTGAMRDKMTKFASTGVIVKKSPYKVFQEPWDEELDKIFEVGFHVGFNPTTPWAAPGPPYIMFERGGMDDPPVNLIIIHMADIISIFDFKVVSNG